MANGESSGRGIPAARERLAALAVRAAALPPAQRALLDEALAAAGALAEQLSDAARRLADSEARFRTLAEGTNDILYSADANGILTYISPQVARYGLNPEDMMSRPFLDFVIPEDRERLAAEFARSVTTGEEFPTEIRVIDGGGRLCWFEDHGKVQRDASGRVSGVNGVLRDITDRKRAEQALRDSEEKFRNFYEKSPIGIELYDVEGRLLEANPACMDIFGICDPAEIAGFRLFEDPNLPAEIKDRVRRGEVVAVEMPFDFEKVRARGLYRTTRRGVIHLEVLIAPLAIEGTRDGNGYLVQVHDVTRRKRLEAEVLAIGQRERVSIGRDLHDSVGQQLTAMAFSLNALREKLAARSLPEAADAASAIDLIKQVTAELRALARGICPVDLKADGLALALEGLADSAASRFGIRCAFVASEPISFQDHSAAIHLYRIAQEAVTNAIKHGKADEVVMRLYGDGDEIALSIQDNGVGIPVDREGNEGMGLDIMRHRASIIGGTLAVQRRPEGGTRVTCSLPRAHTMPAGGPQQGGN